MTAKKIILIGQGTSLGPDLAGFLARDLFQAEAEWHSNVIDGMEALARAAATNFEGVKAIVVENGIALMGDEDPAPDVMRRYESTARLYKAQDAGPYTMGVHIAESLGRECPVPKYLYAVTPDRVSLQPQQAELFEDMITLSMAKFHILPIKSHAGPTSEAGQTPTPT